MIKGVEIQGLREFSRRVRSADKELSKEMRRGMKSIAETVARSAKESVPKRSGKLANSIRPTSTPKVGKVSMGGARVPYAGFIEFGGSVGRNNSVKRPFVKNGRYLRPAYEKNRAQVQIEAMRLIDRIAERLS